MAHPKSILQPQDAVEKAGRLDGLARSKVAKEHGGMRHTVTVTADGFVWQDVRVDRLEPKREAPQARSQDRPEAGRVSCSSIDGDDEEVSEAQS